MRAPAILQLPPHGPGGYRAGQEVGDARIRTRQDAHADTVHARPPLFLGGRNDTAPPIRARKGGGAGHARRYRTLQCPRWSCRSSNGPRARTARRPDTARAGGGIAVARGPAAAPTIIQIRISGPILQQGCVGIGDQAAEDNVKMRGRPRRGASAPRADAKESVRHSFFGGKLPKPHRVSLGVRYEGVESVLAYLRLWLEDPAAGLLHLL